MASPHDIVDADDSCGRSFGSGAVGRVLLLLVVGNVQDFFLALVRPDGLGSGGIAAGIGQSRHCVL